MRRRGVGGPRDGQHTLRGARLGRAAPLARSVWLGGLVALLILLSRAPQDLVWPAGPEPGERARLYGASLPRTSRASSASALRSSASACFPASVAV